MQEIKMILFIISEKRHSPLLMRCPYLCVVNRTWHASTFPVTAGTQLSFMQSSQEFSLASLIARINYKFGEPLKGRI